MRSRPGQPVDQGAPGAKFLSVGEFFLDHEMLRAWFNGRLLTVSMRQYRLIEMFMEAPDQALTREQIMKKVWGREPRSEADVRVVNAEIVRLRRALGTGPDDGPIRNVRGVGFVFVPRPPAAEDGAPRPARANAGASSAVAR